MKNKSELKINEEFIICLSILLLFLYAAFNKIDLIQHKLNLYDWATGDWLINYSAGFIRRGFIGQIILYLHNSFNINPISVILKLREVLYLIILFGFFCIAYIKRIGFVELILSASPWFFMFTINDELATGRKDILFLSCFTIFILINIIASKSNYSNRLNIINFIFLIICLPLLILTHEGLFFYEQYFLLFLFLLNGVNNKDIIVFTIPYLISIFILVLCYFYKGNEDISNRICNSLINMDLNNSLCEGPIKSLAGFNYEFYPELLPLLFLILFLTFAPLYLYARFALISENYKKISLLITLSIIPTIPLYFMAADWGRWIYITSCSLFMTLLATKQSEKIKFISTPLNTIVFLITAYLYVFSWKISHYSGRYDDLNWFFNSFKIWIMSFNLW